MNKVNSNIGTRNITLDILRVLACLGVILVHTAGGPIVHGWVKPGSIEYAMCTIMGAPLRWSPLFVMLTGFFMLNPQKELPLKKLYGKNVLHLIIAQIFWTFFYAATIHWHWYPFGGQDSHFWYIGMCIGLYISMPILRLIAANKKVLSYSCWIWLFIRCYYFVGKFVKIPIIFTDFVFTDFVGYCLVGWYLSQVKLKTWHKRLVYLVGIAALVVNTVVSLVSSLHITANEDPTIICTSIALFLFFIEHPINPNNLSDRMKKVIFDMSKSTFGIYMAHIFVLTELHSRVYRFIQQPILLTVVTVGATFVISYGITWILRKIPFVGKWVV